MNALLGLNNPNNVSQAFQYGYDVSRQRKKEEQAREEQQRRTQVVGDALTGRGPRDEIAYFDPKMYMSLSEQDAKEAERGWETVGQLALMADSPQKWDSIVSQLGPDFQQYVGRFDQREAVIAQAGQAKAFLAEQKPQVGYIPYDAVGYGKNAAGDSLLRQMNGGQPQPGPQGGPASPPPENPNPGAGVTIATQDQVAKVTQALGSEAAAQQYMQRNNIIEAKELNGQTYYKVGGQWFDNPEGR